MCGVFEFVVFSSNFIQELFLNQYKLPSIIYNCDIRPFYSFLRNGEYYNYRLPSRLGV